MLVIVSLWLENYQSLADLTTRNKQEYADRYGYKTFFQKVDGRRNVSFKKIALILEAFDKFPECPWVWFSDCDSMITNMTIKVDPIPLTDEAVFMYITEDFNGVNAGNLIVKNCPAGRDFLNFILSKENSQLPGETNEQDIISTAWNNPAYSGMINILKQNQINSYDMSLYPGAPSKGSLKGGRSQWEAGDLAIHWPGSSLEKRIELFKKYEPLVVR